MAASRSTRVTRSSVGLNGLDENFCGRTLRNRSIAQPEECQGSPLPGSRAPRSPKKRQDDQAGASEKPGGHQGKVAHHKATLVDGETWASPRKRVLFCSEREGVGGSEKAENCEGRDASPLLKRAKRCFRSGESHGSKDGLPSAPPMPVIPASPCAPLTTVKENSEGGDLLRQNSTAASPSSSSPDLNKEEGEEEEEDDGHVQQLLNSNSHKSCIGLGQTSSIPDAQTNSLCLSAASNTTCPGPAVLNGSQRGAPCPSLPDPIVPCRNYDPGQEEGKDSDPGQEEGGKDTDPGQEEECKDSDPGQEEEGEDSDPGREEEEFTMPLLAPPTRSDPPCTPSISSTSPPSFTEPHEHRYTLRTSPRRAACGGGKAVAPCSSPRYPLREGVEAGRELVATPTLSSCSSIQASEGSLLSPPSVPMEQGNGGARRDRVGWDSMGHGELCETRGGLEEVPGGGSQQEDDPDVYYFESDHLTLKHNKDYQRLLQTVGVLEAQRTQSIRDLERLARQQRKALRDPVSFVEQLQKQVELDLPRPQRVVQLPDVSWDQYTSGLGDFEREFCNKKRTTRRLQLIFDKVRLPDGPKSPLDPKKEEGEPSTLYSALPSSDALENSNNSQRIRGRLCYQSKPDTFNQLWTVEEQKKLEHLLLQFSPEEVESKRWQKIADALGNRTAKQVASRVQKFFIKLTKAGIPVPGRTPNICIYSKKVSNKRQHHLNKHLYRPSTFLTSYEPPVFMEEEDERAAYYSSLQDPDGDDTDEEGVPVELRHLPEYKELLELKRMKKHKLQEIQAECSMALHHGYKCDVCGVEPIQGVRWHCQDCPSDNAVDFCSNCSGCLYKTESHLPSHHLEPVHHHETFLDRDYCLAQTPGYNYLDPNYYPANR
uniref:ZZ-type zinc finger-containing protein 3 n=1 Tax=Oncorhynchus kisutch TaxID=8019 RepID=A0A8C7JPU2_ONCKI